MDTKTYQRLAMLFKKDLEGELPELDIALGQNMLGVIFAGFGIGGEAGELQDAVKKQIFHNRWGTSQDFEDKIVDELGDLLWYCAAMCEALGVNMGAVMKRNLDKLNKRYKDGYSDEAARAKAEEDKPANRIVFAKCDIEKGQVVFSDGSVTHVEPNVPLGLARRDIHYGEPVEYNFIASTQDIIIGSERNK